MGYGHPCHIGNPYTGYIYIYTLYINPYEWTDDHLTIWDSINIASNFYPIVAYISIYIYPLVN